MASAEQALMQVGERDKKDEDLDLHCDVPRIVAELSTCSLVTISILLVIAAIGLNKVNAPAEDEFCLVKTWHLENATKTEQDSVMVLCKGLYVGVFGFTRFFAIIDIVILLLPLISIRLAYLQRRKGKEVRYHILATVVNVVGILVLWVPSSYLLTLSAGVTIVMAPLTAQWLIIYAAYFGTKVAKGVPTPHWLTILYQGYVACWYTDTCLWIGTACSWLLWGIYIGDAVRNILGALGVRPNYEHAGSETCYLKRLACRRLRESCAATDNWLRSGGCGRMCNSFISYLRSCCQDAKGERDKEEAAEGFKKLDAAPAFSNAVAPP